MAVDTKEKLENLIMTLPASAKIVFMGSAGSNGEVTVNDVKIKSVET